MAFICSIILSSWQELFQSSAAPLSMANYGELHIAMFPWLAFGHLIPFLELAKLMAAKRHKISFISTPKNIHRLPHVPPELTPFIHFVEIHLPKVDNLPENAESTKDLPFDKVKYLKIACDGLRQPIADFLRTSSPDWIIGDFATYWLGPLAAEHSVRTAYFSVFPAVMLGFLGSPEVNTDGEMTIERLTKLPRWVSFESTVGVSAFQVTRNSANFTDEGENVNDKDRMTLTVNSCDVMVVRSSWEFEPEWLKLVGEINRKPVIPAGLLPAAEAAVHTSDGDNGDVCWRETKAWLDKQEKGSVVYVAFGTETKPNQYELTQLALGLEMSKLPFYWVLLKQRGSSDDEAIELPHGFEERVRGRGVVCTGWAPQFKILSHDSVGGLLIHAGMSSVVEGLQLGKTLIALPFLVDQGIIASYLAEKKMAYMIPRNELDGSFSPESVAESLSLAIVREEGKVYREKAKEMMPLVGDTDIQGMYLEELLHVLKKS